MHDDGHRAITIGHHEHTVLRWAKKQQEIWFSEIDSPSTKNDLTSEDNMLSWLSGFFFFNLSNFWQIFLKKTKYHKYHFSGSVVFELQLLQLKE